MIKKFLNRCLRFCFPFRPWRWGLFKTRPPEPPEDPPEKPQEPEPTEPENGDPVAVGWKEFAHFLKTPAWREIRAEAVAEINELNQPLPDDKMGHDQILARGVREYTKARIHYYFIELPDEMLEQKAREFDKDV